MGTRAYMRALAALVGLCLLLSGCGARLIAEDRVRDDLPLLNPADGVAKDISVELYYRLTGEAYLVPVIRNISVRANERAETAIVRTLLEGVPQQSLSANVSTPFPEGINIVEMSLDSGILYVTLSAEFLDESIVENVRQASAFGSYEEALQRAEEEMYLARRLGIYSLVNTLSRHLGKETRVQILVDAEGTGKGARLPGDMLGLGSRGEAAGNDLIVPLSFDPEVVVSPERIVNCMLSRMQSGEYEMAYVLFLEVAAEGVQKPTYANFETEMLGLGSITGFEVISASEAGDGTATVTVNLDFKSAAGRQTHMDGVQIPLKREGDLYKIGYGSFKSILEAA